MKVIGFMTLHYGKEYLRESLISVLPFVEKIVISYTLTPSHGVRKTGLICPDTQAELFKIALDVCGDKLIWDCESRYTFEAEHRAAIYKYITDEDIVLIVDADEVYEPKELTETLKYVYESKEQYFGIDGYINFWRSFDWCCRDWFRPIRFENLKNKNRQQNLTCKQTIYHFSTAMPREVMEYKYAIFGHAHEIKPNYLNEIFFAWTPEKQTRFLHPTSNDIWGDALPFDKELLPDFLKQHKYYNLKLIE